IHHAARAGWPSTIEYLSSEGANINAASTSGKTPLHDAVIAGHTATVKTLLRLGA
ncbi:hypothetical protein B0J13DRAFT_400472, partial [Dactylonectria estremocensis]